MGGGGSASLVFGTHVFCMWSDALQFGVRKTFCRPGFPSRTAQPSDSLHGGDHKRTSGSSVRGAQAGVPPRGSCGQHSLIKAMMRDTMHRALPTQGAHLSLGVQGFHWGSFV